jgi:geranylgeranyl transferase type-2 subunit alpha
MINQDLYLCAKMLEKDERNFHVWNYRNWVANVRPDPIIIKGELNYTYDKI